MPDGSPRTVKVDAGSGDAARADPVLFDLARFDLQRMIECGRAVREASAGAESMEEAAARIVRLLHERLADCVTGERNCALVRCFKTHRYGKLPVDLAAVARGMLSEGGLAEPKLPVLTLLATAGEEVEWNDRQRSRGHAAIPLESVAFVERAPMIAALIGQMGLGIESAMYPSSQVILDAEEHAFNVFFVADAQGDATIPAQEGFVLRHGIRSVLGFGGLLPSGELFAVILFTRILLPRETANLFRTIALHVKLALLPFTRGPVFAGETGRPARIAGERETEPLGDTEGEQIRSETATLRLLIQALEEAALYQTKRLKAANSELQVQGEHVRQQGMRLSAMLEATSDAVFLLDRQWKFTFLNGHAQRLIANGKDLLGMSVWEVFPEAEGKEFWRQYQRVMQEGVSVEFQEYYPEPLDKWFEVHAFPSEDGMAAFFRDVTDRRKTEATLRQTEKLAATGRLAASIAHEINNPLEAVTNLLYLLGTDETMGPASRQFVQDAESELRRVSEITTHMLRFYRQSTSPAEVDVRKVIESVLVLFGGRLAQGSVQVEKRFAGAPKLRGFAGELRQVFANLVGNALDASRQGGRLVLKVRPGKHAVSGEQGVRVTVADTGGGMTRATTARIFEPFFTTKGITGTGLGLWVSLELVQKHGGTVRVRSCQEVSRHGTVFHLFFPVAGVSGKAA